MYWICFGDSAKGCLAVVRRSLDPAMDVEHILALSDDYSQGDIRDVTDRSARADILMPWHGDPEMGDAWQADYQAQHWAMLDQLNKVDEAVIWYAGGNALEQCGLRYVVSRLYERHIPVWVAEVNEIPLAEIQEPEGTIGKAAVVGVITGSRVMNALLRRMPQCILRRYAARLKRRHRTERAQNGKVRYGLVGEMEVGAAAYFYKRRRQLTETEQAALLTEWARLQEENTPLRAMVNGRVQSVPADFYDEMILSCVPEGESRAALTIGRTLVKLDQQTGNRVSDMLIFSRIRALGAAGRIEIVQDGATYRDMTIRKIGG